MRSARSLRAGYIPCDRLFCHGVLAQTALDRSICKAFAISKRHSEEEEALIIIIY